MSKCGIVIESWKLDVFKSKLTDSGYLFNQCPGPAPGTLLLQVETDNVPALANVIEKAHVACRRH